MSALSHLKHGLIFAACCSRPRAFAAHWDLPSCYIDVHNGCFVNQSQPAPTPSTRTSSACARRHLSCSKGVSTKKKFKVQG